MHLKPDGPQAWRLLLTLALALEGVACGPRGDSVPGAAVFAAASLQEVATELAAELERREGVEVELNLAGSNTLAQQILAAPGADVFISADRNWVDVLEKAGRLVAGSRRALLSNRLVLISATGADSGVTHPRDLARADFSFLALADPTAVPAGRYAKRALEEIRLDGGSLWQAISGRVAPALDVRAALALVESDPTILGIVYGTDAARSRGVQVLHEFPARGATLVTYHGAVVKGGRRPDLGERLLELFAADEGRRIAERYGFKEPAP